MLSVIVVNAWRFFPFAIVIFLAGITAVPQDVLDAATVDGAGFWRRNYQIIVPMILPIVAIGLIFGIVFTFTDLSIVFLMTMGGPIGATSVLGFAGFQTGIVSGDVSHGAAISLFMLPVLLVVVIFDAALYPAAGDLTCRASPSPTAVQETSFYGAVAFFFVLAAFPVLLDGDHVVQEERRSLQRHQYPVLVQRPADARAFPLSVRENPVRDLAVEFA